MVGIGETKDQIINTIKDLRNTNVDFLTIGQYLYTTKYFRRQMKQLHIRIQSPKENFTTKWSKRHSIYKVGNNKYNIIPQIFCNIHLQHNGASNI